MWLLVVYTSTPDSSQAPLFSLMFSCIVHRLSNFLLQIVITAKHKKVNSARTSDEILFILQIPQLKLQRKDISFSSQYFISHLKVWILFKTVKVLQIQKRLYNYEYLHAHNHVLHTHLLCL